MSLSDIVNVSITRQTTAVSRAGFGTPLLLGPSPTFTTEYVRYYSGSTALADASTDLGGVNNAQYQAASAFMSQDPKPTQFALGYSGDTSNMTVALGNIANVSTDWYSIVNCNRNLAQDQECADWAEANEKIFVNATDDSRCWSLSAGSDTTTMAYYASANNLARTFVMFSGDADSTSFPEAAAFGLTATRDPGSYTLMFKTMSGVVADELTGNAQTNLRAKNCSYFHEVAGVDIIDGGTKVGEGEYLDVIIFCDWLKARIAEDVFTALINNEKLPFTDNGIQAIVGIVKARLEVGINQGGLADDPAPTVTAPAAEDVPAADKASRTLNDVVFRGTLAGAIHATNITGYISV
jgi:hypothetical protein